MMLSRVLCLELAQYGIRSNVVSPGFSRTPANEASYRDPETAAARQRRIRSGRVADPVDLAHVIAFLASDRADYINGQDIVVDGGASNILLGVPRADGNPERYRRLLTASARFRQRSRSQCDGFIVSGSALVRSA